MTLKTKPIFFSTSIPLIVAPACYTRGMADTIFTKIIKGEIPSYKVYEDDKTLAFLDIHPLMPGHVLVVPKTEVEFVWDLPDEYYQALMSTVKKVAVRMRESLPQQYIHERIVGIDVPHAHVQLIPFDTTDELSKQQDMDSEPDHAELAQMAEKLRLE